MKRNSKAYRFQLIKETAERHQRSHSADPMVRHIENLMSVQPSSDEEMSANSRFAGHHYDQASEGWVSDNWK